MIHTLPGNQLDVLVQPLATLLTVPVDNPLLPDQIMVQHQGMQHWLSMQLAEHPDRRISMNLEFPLPVRQMWTLTRQILGSRVPERSPYSREVLVWRLDALLASAEVTNDSTFADPTRYWQRQSPGQQAVRRYQLAEELADLYEQYLMYRPDWIERWDSGQADHWQARLWQLLVRDKPDHPVRLVQDAFKHLRNPAEPLPERLFLFGINAMAPIWLDFIKALSDKAGVDFHIFYLNPSDEYWGDIASEKQIAKQRARWIEAGQEEEPMPLEVGNPLVANLGQQGQAFVKLLSDKADIESPVFIEPEAPTLLGQLQRDLLHLKDGREQPSEVSDHSVCIARAHSALREVQGLHDWLLHQFNAQPDLTPKDVLVMCPNVENYAPFIEAVFARRFDDLSDRVPPLPCSIADRSLKDADPTVAAFLDLLTLPDARFQVSQVIGWLRVPAIQSQFRLTPEDVDQLARWLESATVHWGLDADHKAQWINGEVSDHFSWQQGLDRLLLGFAWGDEATILGDRLLVPDVEGADALQLGRLMHFVDRLKQLNRDLNQPRTASSWQQFLQERLQRALFATDDAFTPAHDDLRASIDDLADYCLEAGYTGEIPLTVVRHCLQQSFANPLRTGRQFMTGQITVCSMVPMRSIPFRVVAVLGLNEGEFPRQRPPLGFDLMADDKARLGDRSLRGDDRYLFLEAILSARDALYLSYQGRDVHTNTERQPSLVLTELMDYLKAASGWKEKDIHTLALQPFSAANYQPPWPSFDPHWLRLHQPLDAPENCVPLEAPKWPDEISVNALVDFFHHPSRQFARQRLGLFLGYDDRPLLEDAEPFATNHLQRYQLQAELVQSRLGLIDTREARLMAEARLSGRLPDHPLVENDLDNWQTQANNFADFLEGLDAKRLEPETVTATIDHQRITAELPKLDADRLLFWRLADAKSKDLLRLWLHHLVANLDRPITTLGLYRERKTDAVYQLACRPIEDAKAELTRWLNTWRQGLGQPLPYNADIAIEMTKPRERGEYQPQHFDKIWQGDWFSEGLSTDPYIQFFWPQPPDHDALYEALTDLYAPLFEHLEQVSLNVG